MSSKPSLDSLASAYLGGSISAEDLLLLEELLLSNPDARREFRRLTNLDSALRDWAPICAAQAAWADAAPTSQPKRRRWQVWSAAAALVFAGLVTGFASGSLVSARSLAAREIRSISMPLANGNFESPEAPAAKGCPKEFGKWSGDFNAVVSQDQGIQAPAGHKMLRFLRADNQLTTPNSTPSISGELWQLVDLHSFRSTFGEKSATVELSALFNSAPIPEGQRYSFGISAFAFQGTPDDAAFLWKHRHDVALVSTDKEELSDNDPSTWQKLTTQFVVPPDADLILIHIRTAPKPFPHDLKSTVVFPGQYTADVSLRLLIDSPIQ